MLEPEFYFSVIDKPAQDSLARLADLTGKSTGQVIRERGPALGRYLAEATQPIAGMDTSDPDGGSLAARNLGRAAVARDIGRVYSPASKTYDDLKRFVNSKGSPVAAKAFWKAVKEGDNAYAEQLLRDLGVRAAGLKVGPFDEGARHRQMRNSRGGINKGVRPDIIADKRALADYMKKIQKRVGFAKSGWITAARQIKGGGRIAAWIANQGAPGRGVDETANLTEPKISLTNEVRYLRKILSPRYELRAVEDFGKSLLKEIEARLEYLARKESAHANAADSTPYALAA